MYGVNTGGESCANEHLYAPCKMSKSFFQMVAQNSPRPVKVEYCVSSLLSAASMQEATGFNYLRGTFKSGCQICSSIASIPVNTTPQHSPTQSSYLPGLGTGVVLSTLIQLS